MFQQTNNLIRLCRLCSENYIFYIYMFCCIRKCCPLLAFNWRNSRLRFWKHLYNTYFACTYNIPFPILETVMFITLVKFYNSSKKRNVLECIEHSRSIGFNNKGSSDILILSINCKSIWYETQLLYPMLQLRFWSGGLPLSCYCEEMRVRFLPVGLYKKVGRRVSFFFWRTFRQN